MHTLLQWKQYWLALALLALTAASPAALALDINRADAATLAKELDGIGPKKAKAIVDYRKKNGSFKSTDDLLKVPGIGNATVYKNRSRLGLKQGKTKLTAPTSKAKSRAKSKAVSAKSKATSSSRSSAAKSRSSAAKATSSKAKAKTKPAAKKSTAKSTSNKR